MELFSLHKGGGKADEAGIPLAASTLAGPWIIATTITACRRWLEEVIIVQYVSLLCGITYGVIFGEKILQRWVRMVCRL